MGRTRGPYVEEFPVGTAVRIKDAAYLREFRLRWTFHHPISAEQLEFAGRIDKVAGVGFYHGGDELYKLENTPGTWHEELLESV